MNIALLINKLFALCAVTILVNGGRCVVQHYGEIHCHFSGAGATDMRSSPPPSSSFPWLSAALTESGSRGFPLITNKEPTEISWSLKVPKVHAPAPTPLYPPHLPATQRIQVAREPEEKKNVWIVFSICINHQCIVCLFIGLFLRLILFVFGSTFTLNPVSCCFRLEVVKINLPSHRIRRLPPRVPDDSNFLLFSLSSLTWHPVQYRAPVWQLLLGWKRGSCHLISSNRLLFSDTWVNLCTYSVYRDSLRLLSISCSKQKSVHLD